MKRQLACFAIAIATTATSFACGPEDGLARRSGGRGFNPGLANRGVTFDGGNVLAAQQRMGQSFVAQVNGHHQLLAAQAAARRERMRPVRLARAERLREIKLAKRARKREYILAKEAERRRAKAEAEDTNSPDGGRVLLASTYSSLGR